MERVVVENCSFRFYKLEVKIQFSVGIKLESLSFQLTEIAGLGINSIL